MNHGLESVGRFARFTAAGAICAVLSNLLVWGLTSAAGFNYLVAVTIAFFMVNYVGFLLNKFFTFQSHEAPWRVQALRYYLVMLLSLSLNLALMASLVELLRLPVMVACLAMTVIFVPLNFVAHRLWTFGRRHNAAA